MNKERHEKKFSIDDVDTAVNRVILETKTGMLKCGNYGLLDEPMMMIIEKIAKSIQGKLVGNEL
ncbi:MAG: hypothetical protein RSA49_00210 [Anaerovoracaceae bacterium]